MKNIFKSILTLTLFAGLVSCEDEQDLLILTPPTSFNIITPLTGDLVVLNETTPNNPGLVITWTDAEFGQQAVISYSVELDKPGAEFSNPILLGTTSNSSLTVSSADLNIRALTAGATPFVASTVEIRVVATTGTNSAQTTKSNTISYIVTAYGCLGQFGVGAGIPAAGWGWSSPLNMICDDNVLTAKTNLINDTFRFFTTEGDWNSGRNYPYYANLGYKFPSVLVNANDGDNNFRFNGTPGSYRIKIDENQKFITVARSTVNSGLEPTSTWLVGAATPGGWSWSGDNETELPLVSNNIFETPIILNSGETFRVFLGNNGGDSWGLGDKNYPWYINDGYTIDSELINALDGDSNFRYVGPTGLRVFKIDTVAKTITVD
jgi:hypothetical protein